MAEKVGELIREARTKAGLTQEKLARKVGGITAEDVSDAERGVTVPTAAVLKKIAVATGVTQASLLGAAKGASAKARTGSSAKASAAKTPDSAGITLRVTAAEKRLIEAYRLADGDAKKAALSALKGESADLVGSLLGKSSGTSDTVADMIGDALGNLLGKK